MRTWRTLMPRNHAGAHGAAPALWMPMIAGASSDMQTSRNPG
jgi:hypothetical protein